MTKRENKLLADKIRTIIRDARKKGYTYRFFFTEIHYTKYRVYNFMSHERKMSDEDLLSLKEFIETELHITI